MIRITLESTGLVNAKGMLANVKYSLNLLESVRSKARQKKEVRNLANILISGTRLSWGGSCEEWAQFEANAIRAALVDVIVARGISADMMDGEDVVITLDLSEPHKVTK